MGALGTTWRVAKRPLALAGVLAGQMAHAIRRPDLPSLTDQDPSGVFGDPAFPPLRITVLGDSIVTAPGVAPLDACWARRTAISLTDRFHVELISVAKGGSKARDVLRDQVERAIETEPDVAYVCVGGNDALRATPIARFEKEYDQIVAALHEAVPVVGCSGIGDLSVIPRLPAVVGGVAKVRGRSVDHAVARVVARYPRARKSNAWHAGYQAFETNPETWAGDLFHSSAEGHALFAEFGSIPLMEELLELRSGLGVRGSGESSP